MEENDEVPHGWPFGLGNMNPTIVAADASPAAVPPQPRIHRSSSFSSFSSSNLDTESTASFFPDHSVSLGLLIGIKPVNKGRLIIHHRGLEFPDGRSHLRVSKDYEKSQGICVPLLHNVIGKMSRNGSNKR